MCRDKTHFRCRYFRRNAPLSRLKCDLPMVAKRRRRNTSSSMTVASLAPWFIAAFSVQTSVVRFFTSLCDVQNDDDLLNSNRLRRCLAKHFGFVHTFGSRGRGLEIPVRCRPDEVRQCMDTRRQIVGEEQCLVVIHL